MSPALHHINRLLHESDCRVTVRDGKPRLLFPASEKPRNLAEIVSMLKANREEVLAMLSGAQPERWEQCSRCRAEVRSDLVPDLQRVCVWGRHCQGGV